MIAKKPLSRFGALLLAVSVATAIITTAGGGPSAGAATPSGPFTVELSNRENVRRFFFSTYQASQGVAVGWTGDVARCDAGTVSNDFLEATRTRINYFRAMAGVPSDVVFTAENNAKAQATALLLSAQRQLSHDPPNTWKCWTAAGAAGAKASNLQSGSTGPTAIDDLMADDGDLGHRRTILNPQNIEMGSGSIPANPDGNEVEAQYMADNPDPTLRAVRDGFVAWPPKGFVPYQNTFPLWHFSRRDADFSNAAVAMTRNGAPLDTTATNRADLAGPGIVWNTAVAAEGTTWPKPTQDDTYRVTISNVVVGGAPQTFTYDVVVFDPDFGDAARTVLQIAGPDAPPVGVDATYTATGVPNTTGYQWRTSRLVPIAAAEGGEGGLGNFVATVGGYNPVANVPVATGAASLRLTIRTDANPTNTATLTDRRVLVPTATSQLQFKSRAISTANVADLVQASTDDGATWTNLFTDPSADDAAFVDRTVSLAAFAGRHVVLRFRSQPAGTGGWSGGDQFGWYVDDVTLTDTFAADVSDPVLTPTPAFTLNPRDAALIDIEVRPQFVASGFGEWAPARRVAPAGPPLIIATPAPLTVVAGGNATFTVAATGPAPLGYVWSLNGVDLADAPTVSGSRTATLRLTNVQPAQAGTYRARVANGLGARTSEAATLTVTAPPPTLEAALDSAGLLWTTGGDRGWLAQTAVAHDTVDAARSAPIGDDQSSRLSTTVTGPATVSFWWKVSSEATFDFLTVELDGTRPFDGISGDVDWRQQTVTVAAGAHELAFVYRKDSSQAAGADSGWVDSVTTAPIAAPPGVPTAGLPAAPATLADALNTAALVVTTTGDAGWVVARDVTHDGAAAARSGTISDDQASRLETTISGPATLRFWWKVDSERDFDFLHVELDGVRAVAGISGNVDWQQQTVAIPAGTHRVRWVYLKDESQSVGQDAGWVDQITLT